MRINYGRPALSAPSTDFSYSYSYTFEPWYDDDANDSYGKSRVVVLSYVRTSNSVNSPLDCFTYVSAVIRSFERSSRWGTSLCHGFVTPPTDLLHSCRPGF